MKIAEFRKIIQERIKCYDEYTFGVEQCWKKEIEVLTEDIPSTIEFFKNECTEDEFSWISEIIDDIVEIAPNRELLDSYKSLMEKFPKECFKYNIAGSISEAETILDSFEEQKSAYLLVNLKP